MRRVLSNVSCSLSVALLLGCGGNVSEIPPELLAAIAGREQGGDGDYPAGPYGTAVGDVARDFCFEGWTDPSEVSRDEVPPLEPICFSDFYDPSGDGASYLLVNAAAVWCTACRAEYQGTSSRPSLSDALAARRDRGFRVLGTLFQDANSDPATVEDGVVWVTTFDVDFPFVLDRDFKLGAYTSAAQAPYNLVLDLRTMEIVIQVEGDQPAVLFGKLDALLDAE